MRYNKLSEHFREYHQTPMVFRTSWIFLFNCFKHLDTLGIPIFGHTHISSVLIDSLGMIESGASLDITATVDQY